MNLPRIFSWHLFYHIVVEWIIFIVADCADIAFAQSYFINFAILVQLECYVVRFYHLCGNSIKQFAFSIPVSWVLSKYFFVVLNVCSHGVWTIIPHCSVVHCTNTISAAQFINHCLRHWEQTSIGCYRVKVWFWIGTMIDYSVIIWNFHTNHFKEFGAFPCGKSFSFFFGQSLGIFIILGCAFDHFDWHRGINGVIFMEVEYPFQTGCKVVRCNVCFFICIDVNPFYAFTKLKGPGQATVFCAPFFCNSRNQFTMSICFKKTVYRITKDIKFLLALAAQNIKGLHFVYAQLRNYEVFDFIFGRSSFCGFCLFLSCSLSFTVWLIACFICCTGRSTTTQHEHAR